MKRWLLVILIFDSILGFCQNKECEKFKEGKFEIIDSGVVSSSIVREGLKQVEYSKEINVEILSKVLWIDECTYKLELEEILKNPNNIPLPKDLVMTVEIIETKENSYIQRSFSNYSDIVVEYEVFKVVLN